MHIYMKKLDVSGIDFLAGGILSPVSYLKYQAIEPIQSIILIF